MEASFLSHIPVYARVPFIIGLVGLVIWSLAERVFYVSGQYQTKGDTRDRGSYLALAVFWYAAVLGSLVDANWLRWSTFSEKWVSLLYLGVPFLLAGAVARVLARWTLGKSFSHVVQTSGSHQLVTTGIYGLVRHPAYLGTLCLLIGFPLCFGSWLGLGIALVFGVPAQIYRIQVEEQALRDWFGEDYEEYCRRTKRLVPFIW